MNGRGTKRLASLGQEAPSLSLETMPSAQAIANGEVDLRGRLARRSSGTVSVVGSVNSNSNFFGYFPTPNLYITLGVLSGSNSGKVAFMKLEDFVREYFLIRKEDEVKVTPSLSSSVAKSDDITLESFYQAVTDAKDLSLQSIDLAKDGEISISKATRNAAYGARDKSFFFWSVLADTGVVPRSILSDHFRDMGSVIGEASRAITVRESLGARAVNEIQEILNSVRDRLTKLFAIMVSSVNQDLYPRAVKLIRSYQSYVSKIDATVRHLRAVREPSAKVSRIISALESELASDRAKLAEIREKAVEAGDVAGSLRSDAGLGLEPNTIVLLSLLLAALVFIILSAFHAKLEQWERSLWAPPAPSDYDEHYRWRINDLMVEEELARRKGEGASSGSVPRLDADEMGKAVESFNDAMKDLLETAPEAPPGFQESAKKTEKTVSSKPLDSKILYGILAVGSGLLAWWLYSHME